MLAASAAVTMAVTGLTTAGSGERPIRAAGPSLGLPWGLRLLSDVLPGHKECVGQEGPVEQADAAAAFGLPQEPELPGRWRQGPRLARLRAPEAGHGRVRLRAHGWLLPPRRGHRRLTAAANTPTSGKGYAYLGWLVQRRQETSSACGKATVVEMSATVPGPSSYYLSQSTVARYLGETTRSATNITEELAALGHFVGRPNFGRSFYSARWLSDPPTTSQRSQFLADLKSDIADYRTPVTAGVIEVAGGPHLVGTPEPAPHRALGHRRRLEHQQQHRLLRRLLDQLRLPHPGQELDLDEHLPRRRGGAGPTCGDPQDGCLRALVAVAAMACPVALSACSTGNLDAVASTLDPGAGDRVDAEPVDAADGRSEPDSSSATSSSAPSATDVTPRPLLPAAALTVKE